MEHEIYLMDQEKFNRSIFIVNLLSQFVNWCRSCSNSVSFIWWMYFKLDNCILSRKICTFCFKKKLNLLPSNEIDMIIIFSYVENIFRDSNFISFVFNCLIRVRCFWKSIYDLCNYMTSAFVVMELKSEYMVCLFIIICPSNSFVLFCCERFRQFWLGDMIVHLQLKIDNREEVWLRKNEMSSGDGKLV